MSKHLGNVVDPWSVLDAQGARRRPLVFLHRLHALAASRFGPDNVSESQRKFMGTYWNTYAFYVLYAEIDQFNPAEHSLVRENLSKMDLWILSRLNTLIGFVDEQLESLHITEGGPRDAGLRGRPVQLVCAPVQRPVLGQRDDRRQGGGLHDPLHGAGAVLPGLCAPFLPFQ